ncbi:MAG: hypothetical protein GY869_01420, partial [Planctomycetes bacterium]|nr:hypothetical protein [Planctomycetota bacterium]
MITALSGPVTGRRSRSDREPVQKRGFGPAIRQNTERGFVIYYRMLQYRCCRLLIAGVLFSLLLASPAWAIDYTWVGPVMGAWGDWDDPANWSPAPPDPPGGPVPGDSMIFNTNVNLMMGADRVVDSVNVTPPSNSMSFINFALETTDMTVESASISASNGLTVNNGTLNIATRYRIISGDLIINGSNNITGPGVFRIDAGC